MELKRINKKEFAKYYDLLEKDFIFEERRTKENELKCISNKYFNVCFIFSKELNKNIGYFSYWDFDEFSSNFITWHLKEITLVATRGRDRRWTKMETCLKI